MRTARTLNARLLAGVPGLTLHDTGIAPDHANPGVVKGCPPPLSSPREGEGTRSAGGAFSRLRRPCASS
jgi:hypothetical protein